jgi:hypothetical protein
LGDLSFGVVGFWAYWYCTQKEIEKEIEIDRHNQLDA